MKPITAISIFFCLMLPSLFLSYGNYSVTRERIIDDVNQALAKTIMKENHRRVTEDTLRIFRSNLKMEELKAVSYLSLCTVRQNRAKRTFAAIRCAIVSGMKECIFGHIRIARERLFLKCRNRLCRWSCLSRVCCGVYFPCFI